MAERCEQCQEKRQRLYWITSPNNHHHFVKPMLNDFKNTLKIPKKFTDEFRVRLSDTVLLRGPSGHYWTTTLEQRGTGFVLALGWRRFVQDQGLNRGDFLVFRHVQDSIFDVLIFDDSGCEKEASHFVGKHGKFPAYTCCSVHQAEERKEKDYMLDDDDDDDDDHDDHDDDGDGDGDGDDYNVEEEEEEEEEEEQEEEIDCEETWQGSSGEEMKIEMPVITEKEKKRVYEKASKFRSKKPSCKIKMKASSVNHLFTVTVPKEFADNCLPKTSQTITLRNNSGTWRVQLNRWPVQCTLTRGWQDFVRENRLGIEDYCVFELATKKPYTVLDVHIFRAVKKNAPTNGVKASMSG